jgi:hypothetical protein
VDITSPQNSFIPELISSNQMAHSQVRIGLMVEVNEQEPGIIDVLLPSSQKRLKKVSTANNCSYKQQQYLSDIEKKKEEKKHQQKTG